jgi:hypothetical protein
MKIVPWTTMVAVGLALAACGHGDDNTTTSTSGSGSSGTGSSAPSSSPSSTAPTDFVDFVYQQIGTEPAFGSAPASTTALTSDLELGNAFSQTTFGSGDALPATTYQASVACTQAGKTACNPAVSADLNSNLN